MPVGWASPSSATTPSAVPSSPNATTTPAVSSVTSTRPDPSTATPIGRTRPSSTVPNARRSIPSGPWTWTISSAALAITTTSPEGATARPPKPSVITPDHSSTWVVPSNTTTRSLPASVT